MKGTAFLFAAYDGGMDTLLVLLVLISLDKVPALKDALRNFLGFYKENRELISAVLKQSGAQATAAAPVAEEPAAPQQPPEAKKESRPEQAASLGILEEYLKRCEI